MPHLQFEKLPANDLSTRIKPYSTEITKSAAAGNVRAKEIISLYRMHVNCPSHPDIAGLCAAALDGWLRARGRQA